MITDDQRRRIAELPKDKPGYEDFFRVLGARSRNRSVIELDNFVSNSDLSSLGHEAQRRRLAIEFFRVLDEIGVGQFRIGRRGKATRFVWSIPLLDVVAASGSTTTGTKPFDVEAKPRMEGKLLRHSYVLREDLTVDLELPADLNETEARRLSTFIQTLPLKSEKGED